MVLGANVQVIANASLVFVIQVPVNHPVLIATQMEHIQMDAIVNMMENVDQKIVINPVLNANLHALCKQQSETLQTYAIAQVIQNVTQNIALIHQFVNQVVTQLKPMAHILMGANVHSQQNAKIKTVTVWVNAHLVVIQHQFGVTTLIFANALLMVSVPQVIAIKGSVNLHVMPNT